MLGNLFNQKVTPPVPAAPTAPAPMAAQPPANAQMPVAPVSAQPQQPVQAPPPPQAQNQMPQNPAMIGSSMQPGLRHDLSVLSHLDTRTTQVLQQASQETKRLQLQAIAPEQLLMGLLYDSGIFDMLQSISADASTLSQKLQQTEKLGNFVGEPTLSEESLQVLEKAYAKAQERGVEFMTPEDVFVTLYTTSATVANFLKTNGISKEKIDEQLSKSPEYVMGRRSTLDKFGVDLTEEARAGRLDPVAGREKEIMRLIHILLRRTKNNPVIIGEAGVGKTAIVEGLAQKIVTGDVPRELKDRRIIMLDLAALVAGASHRGEFEERLRSVIKEVQLSEGKIILFIDEIHTVIGAGDSGGAMDASNIIKPFLARGQLQVIGTTTTAEYRRYFEKDKAFERRFQSVLADEPSEEGAIEMLKILRPKYEKFHHVTISDESVEAAVHLSKKYIGERYLPDKAIDLLDEAAAEVKLRMAGLTHPEAPTEKHQQAMAVGEKTKAEQSNVASTA